MSNFFEDIAKACKEVKSKVPYLAATNTPFFEEQNIHNRNIGESLRKDTVTWLNDTVSTILKVASKDLIESKQVPPFCIAVKKHATFITNCFDNDSIVIQTILFSCISQQCHVAIIECLTSKNESNYIVPQKSSPLLKDKLQIWLKRLCFCIKKSVLVSYLEYKTNKNYVHPILFEAKEIGSVIKRSANLFAIVGKNPEILQSVVNDPSNEIAMASLKEREGKSPGITQDLVSIMVFLFENFLNAFLSSAQKRPKEMENKHDILSFMLKYNEIRAKWEGMNDNESSPMGDNELFTWSEEEERNLHAIKSDIEKLASLLKMKKTSVLEQNSMLQMKAKELLPESYLNQDKLAVVHIQVLREGVHKLLSAIHHKKEKLTASEGVLVKIISAAVKTTPDFPDNMESLFSHLTGTLFNIDFIKSLMQMKNHSDSNDLTLLKFNEELWRIHFSEYFQEGGTKKRSKSGNKCGTESTRKRLNKKHDKSGVREARSHKNEKSGQTKPNTENMKTKGDKDHNENAKGRKKKNVDKTVYLSPITRKRPSKPPQNQTRDQRGKRKCPSKERRSPSKMKKLNYDSPQAVVRRSPRSSVSSKQMIQLLGGKASSPPCVLRRRKSPRKP